MTQESPTDKKKLARLLASALIGIGFLILLTGIYEYYLLAELSKTALVAGLFNMLMGTFLLIRNKK